MNFYEEGYSVGYQDGINGNQNQCDHNRISEFCSQEEQWEAGYRAGYLDAQRQSTKQTSGV